MATRLFLALLLLVQVLGCRKVALDGASPADVVRTTVYGRVEGVDDSARSGTCFWKGIPFAKPPVGALRWHAPVAPEPWSGVLPTRAFGPACAQNGRIYGPGLNNTYDATIATTLNQAVGSEDGLYLNIWRPATPEARLPVIFFIHGGSLVSGYTADPMYDGAALARAANAVVVTASYRLGVLGWLNLPQLKTPQDPLGASGNFGTLDQVLALRFVQANIAAFGGNPDNVTAMGQSAGCQCLWSLVTSPLVVASPSPLFHRAILMSAGLALPGELPHGSIALLRPPSYSQAQGRKLLLGLLIADGKAADEAGAEAVAAGMPDAEVAAYLRAQPSGALFKQVLARLAPAGLGNTFHIPDGQVVAPSAIAALKAGAYLKVPMLISGTRDETKLFASFLAMAPALGGKPGLIVDDATRFRMMMGFRADAPGNPAVKDLINPAYLPADAPVTGYDARLARLDAMFIRAQHDAMLGALDPRQGRVWSCRFDWDQEPAPWNTVYGAAHVFDLPFWFGNFGPSLFSNAMNTKANEGGRLALSRAMMGALGAFARTGDPNHPGLGVTWPVWPATLALDATLTDSRLSIH